MFYTLLTLAVVGSFANAAGAPSTLHCTASETVSSQPCGGVDSRTIDLDGASYRESRSYGGCYAVSDEGYGEVSAANKHNGAFVFSLTREGDIMNGAENADPSNKEVMAAQYDPATKKLTLNTKSVFWVYRNAKVLDCTEVP